MNIDLSLISWAVPAVGGLAVAGWWARRRARGFLTGIRLDVGDRVVRPTADGSYSGGRIIQMQNNRMAALLDGLSPLGEPLVWHITLTSYASGGAGQVRPYSLGRQEDRQELQALGLTGAEIGNLDSQAQRAGASR